MEVAVELSYEEKIDVEEDRDSYKLGPDVSANDAIKSSKRNIPSIRNVVMASIRCGTT